MLLPFSQEKNNLENIKSKNKNIVKINPVKSSIISSMHKKKYNKKFRSQVMKTIPK